MAGWFCSLKHRCLATCKLLSNLYRAVFVSTVVKNTDFSPILSESLGINEACDIVL